MKLGRLRGTLSADAARAHLEALRQVPGWMEQMLRQEAAVMPVAKRCASARDVLFLGRGRQYPVALEGALKLKEISYIHAEGYAAGEMKHGPIALIDEKMPVVVLAAKEPRLREDARQHGGGPRARRPGLSRWSPRATRTRRASPRWRSPCRPRRRCSRRCSPSSRCSSSPTTWPICEGTDVDQPRNLAKSVTVE